MQEVRDSDWEILSMIESCHNFCRSNRLMSFQKDTSLRCSSLLIFSRSFPSKRLWLKPFHLIMESKWLRLISCIGTALYVCLKSWNPIRWVTPRGSCLSEKNARKAVQAVAFSTIKQPISWQRILHWTCFCKKVMLKCIVTMLWIRRKTILNWSFLKQERLKGRRKWHFPSKGIRKLDIWSKAFK